MRFGRTKEFRLTNLKQTRTGVCRKVLRWAFYVGCALLLGGDSRTDALQAEKSHEVSQQPVQVED